jgi:hypothetical protein
MREAAKFLSVLLALMVLTAFMVGCPNGTTDEEEEGEYKNPAESSIEFKTYYIKAVDAGREAPWNDVSALNRLHFHAPAGTGFIIEKVFRSDTMAEGVPAGAEIWYDFTKGNDLESCSFGSYSGTIAAGSIEDGAWVFQNSAALEAYPGNLGLALDGKAYLGFVIKNVSNEIKFDNILVEFMHDGDTSYTSLSFAKFFGFSNIVEPAAPEEPEAEPEPLLTTEWKSIYLDLANHGLDTAVNTFHIHAEQGGLEIQKVYVSKEKELANATLVLDFTEASPLVYADGYWIDVGDRILEGGTLNGRYSYQNSTGTYVYGGGFASPAAFDAEAEYWVFIVRNVSDELTGDLVRLELKAGDEPVVTKTIAELFAE